MLLLEPMLGEQNMSTIAKDATSAQSKAPTQQKEKWPSTAPAQQCVVMQTLTFCCCLTSSSAGLITERPTGRHGQQIPDWLHAPDPSSACLKDSKGPARWLAAFKGFSVAVRRVTINALQAAVTSQGAKMPHEFQRQCCAIQECDSWKATEVRQFLL